MVVVCLPDLPDGRKVIYRSEVFRFFENYAGNLRSSLTFRYLACSPMGGLGTGDIVVRSSDFFDAFQVVPSKFMDNLALGLSCACLLMSRTLWPTYSPRWRLEAGRRSQRRIRHTTLPAWVVACEVSL